MNISRCSAIPGALICSLLAPLSVQAATWNEGAVGGDYNITNTTAGVAPFVIDGGSATGTADTLVLKGGNVGLGSTPPVTGFNSRFYVYDPTPEIELDDWDNNRKWQLFADGGNGGSDPLGGIGLADLTAGTNPFYIVSAAPTDSFFMDTTGFVALGFDSPEAKLHVKGDTDGKILVENAPSVVTQTELFEIKNNGNLEFYMTNTNANSSWKFVAGTQGNTPSGDDSFRISKVGQGIKFQVFDTGNATLRGVLTENSDRNAKQDIVEVDHDNVLAKVMALPISEWSYKTAPDSRHIGPMAQDFYQAFQLGNTEKGISSIDTGGVALAAIQALNIQLGRKETKIDSLDKENQALQAQLQEQDARVQQLELAVTELMQKLSTEQRVGLVD